MTLAPYEVSVSGGVAGQFKHKETGLWFDYAARGADDGDWAPELPHLIFVGDGQTRYGIVKKTVAYVAVDEDDFGKPVMEKWPIKNHNNWQED